jgi:hypothetical protein
VGNEFEWVVNVGTNIDIVRYPVFNMVVTAWNASVMAISGSRYFNVTEKEGLNSSATSTQTPLPTMDIGSHPTPTRPPPTMDSESSLAGSVIAGIVFGVLIIVGAAISGLLLWKRRQKRKGKDEGEVGGKGRNGLIGEVWDKAELGTGPDIAHDVVASGLRAEMEGSEDWVHELPGQSHEIYELPGEVEKELPKLPEVNDRYT